MTYKSLLKKDKLGSESEIYKKKSEIYELFSLSQDQPDKITDFLTPLIKNKIVLDLGCGTGKFIPKLAHLSKFYWAIDNSGSQLKIARDKAKKIKNIKIIKASADKLPVESNSIDVVFSTWFIGSVHDLGLRKKIISEASRVIKRSGSIYLIENNTGGDYKELVEGKPGEEKTNAKLKWFKNNGFREVISFKTYFEFKNLKSAKEIFESIFGERIASKIDKKRIHHNIIIYKNEINLGILESVKYVVDNSKFVKINQSKLSDFVKIFKKHKEHYWLLDSPFDLDRLDKNQKLMVVVVFNAISFSYWGDPYWNVEYKGKRYTRGSWSLMACIFRALGEGKNILDAKYLSEITKKELGIILRGNTEIPLLNERVKILREIGSVLLKRYDGNFSNVIKESKGDAIKLMGIILDSFQSFQDFAYYNNKKILFQKRAQGLVEGIYSIFNGKGFGKLKNVNSLTALADYIIPNMLRKVGILKYSEKLIKKVDNKVILKKGCPEEIEIRANTIWAIELIRRELTSKNIKVSALNINDYLWTIGGEVKTPFHLTRTTSY